MKNKLLALLRTILPSLFHVPKHDPNIPELGIRVKYKKQAEKEKNNFLRTKIP